MRSRVVPALLLSSCLWSCSLWGQQPQQPAAPPQSASSQGTSSQGNSIRQTVNLVPVLFTVFNRRNKIITDLDKQDFRVFDDNVSQEIRSFSRQTDLPLRVGLLLDTSNSIRERLQFEQDAAVDFLFNVIRRENDQAFLMTIDDDPEVIQGFTGDTQRLRDVIRKQRAGGGTALYDAIYVACEQLLHAPAPTKGSVTDTRRVLVVISDGDDNLSHHTKSEALEIAQRAGIVIYTISTSTNWILTDEETKASNSGNRKYFKDPGDQVLEQFSDDSGGRAFFPYRVDDLGQSFLDIGDELRSQYSLTYVPTGRIADGKFHTIRIDVSNQGLGFQVHARKGYYATVADLPVPVPAEPAAPVPASSGPNN